MYLLFAFLAKIAFNLSHELRYIFTFLTLMYWRFPSSAQLHHSVCREYLNSRGKNHLSFFSLELFSTIVKKNRKLIVYKSTICCSHGTFKSHIWFYKNNFIILLISVSCICTLVLHLPESHYAGIFCHSITMVWQKNNCCLSTQLPFFSKYCLSAYTALSKCTSVICNNVIGLKST